MQFSGDFLMTRNTKRPKVRQSSFSSAFNHRYDVIGVPPITTRTAVRDAVRPQPLIFSRVVFRTAFERVPVFLVFGFQGVRIQSAQRTNPFVPLMNYVPEMRRACLAAPFLGAFRRAVEPLAFRERPAAVVADAFAVRVKWTFAGIYSGSTPILTHGPQKAGTVQLRGRRGGSGGPPVRSAITFERVLQPMPEVRYLSRI